MLAGIAAPCKLREGDFSHPWWWSAPDELGELMTFHTTGVGRARTQRGAHLVQAGIGCWDTVMQNSPVALVLVDAHDRLPTPISLRATSLSEGRSLNGLQFSELLRAAPPAFRNARHQSATVY